MNRTIPTIESLKSKTPKELDAIFREALSEASTSASPEDLRRAGETARLVKIVIAIREP